MAQLVDFKNIIDERGHLTVIQEHVPFVIKRVFYIYQVGPHVVRGGHAHKKTWQALVCLRGSCEIFVQNKDSEESYVLNSPEWGLILSPPDWHTMQKFSQDALLLVLASEPYNEKDYVIEKYRD